MKTNYVSLDIETTGVEEEDRIIEIGVFVFDEKGKKIKEWESLINPNEEVPDLITSITGIKTEDLKDAPKIDTVKDKIRELTADCPIIGHNLDFDLSFLKAEGIDLTDQPQYDTWKLATILLPEMTSHSLEVLIQRLGIKTEKSHRALEDAKAAAELFVVLQKEIRKISLGLREKILQTIEGQGWQLEDLFKTKEVIKTKPAKKETKIKQEDEDAKWDIDEMEKMFKHNGRLASQISGFEFRKGQVEMMKAVANTLENNEKLIVEAGTGIGKTLAYLLPTIYFAKGRKEKVVLATKTLNLQEQIYQKDIPDLKKILPFDFKTAILKGREWYLCEENWKKFLRKNHKDQNALLLIAKIILWKEETRDGDTSNLRLTWDERKYLQRLSADWMYCNQKTCQAYKEGKCWVEIAREKANKSDLVVLNHALLVAERELKERFLDYKNLVVDEGHHLEPVITDQLSIRIGKDAWNDILRSLNWKDLKITGEGPRLTKEVREKISLFFGLISISIERYCEKMGIGSAYRLTLDDDLRYDEEWEKVEKAWESLKSKLARLEEELKKSKQKSRRAKAEMERVQGVIKEYEKHTDLIMTPEDDTRVSWLEMQGYPAMKVSLNQAPLEIGGWFNEKAVDELESIVVTSATLTTKNKFDYIKERLQLGDIWIEKSIEAGYDYDKQSRLIVMDDIAGPKSPKYVDDLEEIILKTAEHYGGKTMVLFTAHTAIKSMYKRIESRLSEQGIEVLAQKITGGRGKILEKFKSAKKAVVLGTDSFWEGVDVKGDNLKAVIVAKLPFEVPNDPIVKGKMEQYDNGFMEFMVPRAILKLKQGFGRLIRSNKDTGIVIIADRRVVDQRYGVDFIESLPPAKVVYSKKADLRKYFG